MEDWIADHLGWIILALFAGIVWLAIYVAQAESVQRKAFMLECIKDRKEYECVAMWHAGESHTQVVPVFIPSNR